MNETKECYTKLLEKHKDIVLYQSIQMLLGFDQETLMPKKGESLRSEQNALLEKRVFEEMSSDSYSNLLKQCQALDKDSLTDQQNAIIREITRDYEQKTKLSSDIVQELVKASSLALEKWRKAKQANDFSIFQEALEKNITLCQEKAEMLGYKDHPYDALLDIYEPNITTKKLDKIFDGLKKALIPLIKKVTPLSQKCNQTILDGTFNREKQMALSKEIIESMGLDNDRSYLSESSHPMCLALYPNDVRLTTKFHDDDLLKSYFAVIHETGHGLYEANMKLENFGTPLAQAASYGIHESQSRFYETFIGQSTPFCKITLKLFKKHFDELKGVKDDDFYKYVNRVAPTKIRIFADEITYNLHIIVRYEIEKKLIEGSLKAKDLPHEFNRLMLEYFGIKITKDSQGCLQDIHWSLSYFGYFPSYSLGNIYAGSLFETFKEENPGWKEKIENHELSFIRKFLTDKVHQYGREYEPIDLIEKACKKPFSEAPYLNYLRDKYETLFD
jgi:carboxypeptidase Taq